MKYDLFSFFQDAIVSIGPLKLGKKTLLVDGQAVDIEDIEIFEELEIVESSTYIPKYFIYIVVGCLGVVVSLISAIMILVYKKKKANAKEWDDNDFVFLEFWKKIWPDFIP